MIRNKNYLVPLEGYAEIVLLVGMFKKIRAGLKRDYHLK